VKDPQFDVAVADRWFAVELNNLAWQLVEADSRSPEDTERMIHAAHASCWHWLQAGTLLNHLRAQCLISTAYAAAGYAEAALRYAEKCLSLSREAGNAQTPFDRATTHGCAARAYARAGQLDEARRQYEAGVAAIRECTDPEDRVVFDKLYPQP
jgi:tetratricopeptide (TPR) repeat protein